MNNLRNLLLALLFVFVLASCEKNDKEGPTPSESATFTISIENILSPKDFLASGATSLIMPGQQEQYSFNAGKGTYLSLATMFVQSNDLFYAFDEKGLGLYDENGVPRTGDVTALIDLWDAGTEINEAPGTGANQAPRQSGANVGPAENGTVRLIADVDDGYTYPEDEEIIRVSLSHDGGTEFVLTIENVSANSSLPTPLAPGVWAVHGGEVQLFNTGQAADAGLEAIAEDGNNSITVDALTESTGYVSPFAPGVWAVHEADETPIFRDGSPDFGLGLEALAEDGDPSSLNSALNGQTGVKDYGIFDTPQGGAPGLLLPGMRYAFTFEAKAGDYFNLATMLVHTNDLFFAFGENGIALFENGEPISGELNTEILLWDAGTEVNEYPGAGNNQPARGGAQVGIDENGLVREVNDGFNYPAVNEMIRVRVEVSN